MPRLNEDPSRWLTPGARWIRVWLMIRPFGALGSAYVETVPTEVDRDTIIRNMMSGEYDHPLHVIAVILGGAHSSGDPIVVRLQVNWRMRPPLVSDQNWGDPDGHHRNTRSVSRFHSGGFDRPPWIAVGPSTHLPQVP